MRFDVKSACLAVSIAAFGAALYAPVALAAEAAPMTIKIKTVGFVPEGVEYDTKNKRFLVGSLAQGTVFVVANDGTLTPFIQDPDLKSSVGIEVDEERNRLLVPNSDSSVFGGQGAGQAKLGIYDLTSGKRIAMVDLAAAGPKDAKHFANDVTVGSDGSAYVTDTMARVIYKVDPKNNASILLPNTFASIPQFQFNGIVFHPSGYLLVAESATGDLYKVPVAKPESFTKVKLPEQPAGADGIVWHPTDGCLIVVRNDKSQQVVAFKSADNWATATVEGRGTFSSQGTTAAVNSNGVYVVQPFFADAKAQPVIEHVHLAK
jgi:sugar lactone lactonase YvrE